jgi:hypothetical protein
VYVEDRKKLEVKKCFFKFLCREQKKICYWQRNLYQVFFSLPRVFNLALGKEASVPSVIFSVPGVFYLALGKAFFVKSFLFSSRHINEL